MSHSSFFYTVGIRSRLKKSWELEGKPRQESKTAHAMTYLNCTSEEYKNYLEVRLLSMQPLPDGTVATLNNHGLWHIDHIKPIKSFTYSDDDDFYAAFNFENTQPLWAAENLSKGNCVTYFIPLIIIEHTNIII